MRPYKAGPLRLALFAIYLLWVYYSVEWQRYFFVQSARRIQTVIDLHLVASSLAVLPRERNGTGLAARCQ